MAPQTWSVLLVAAAFLLLGVAGSPLAWLALWHRRSRVQKMTEHRLTELANQLRALEALMKASGASARGWAAEAAGPDRSPSPRWPARFQAEAAAHTHGEAAQTAAGAGADGPLAGPTLIAVPAVAAPPGDRAAATEAVAQRYAPIWEMADSGASLQAIARAAGQPVREIELILALRRRLDATRTTIPHAPHAT
jgi:hypothetical protein